MTYIQNEGLAMIYKTVHNTPLYNPVCSIALHDTVAIHVQLTVWEGASLDDHLETRNKKMNAF